MSVMMQRSRTLLEEWLVAAVDGKKPDGEAVEVRLVKPGQIVEVHYSGEGAGGRYHRVFFVGEEPQLMSSPGEALRGRETPGETRVHFAKFVMTAPSVVYESSGVIESGKPHRVLSNVVSFCATDEQIAEARACLPALLAKRDLARREVAAKSRPPRRFERVPAEASL